MDFEVTDLSLTLKVGHKAGSMLIAYWKGRFGDSPSSVNGLVFQEQTRTLNITTSRSTPVDGSAMPYVRQAVREEMTKILDFLNSAVDADRQAYEARHG